MTIGAYPLAVVELCLAEGSTTLTAQNLAKIIEKDWFRWLTLLEQFKSGTVAPATEIPPADAEWIDQVAKSNLQVDPQVLQAIYQSYFQQPSEQPSLNSSWKLPGAATSPDRQSNTERLIMAYHAERSSSIRCWIHLIGAAMRPNHWFHQSAHSLLDKRREDLSVLFTRATEQLEEQFTRLCTPGRSQQRHALLQTLRELKLLSELLFWAFRFLSGSNSASLDPSSIVLPAINQLLGTAFSPRLQFLFAQPAMGLVQAGKESSFGLCQAWQVAAVLALSELLQLNRWCDSSAASATIPISGWKPKDFCQLAEIFKNRLLQSDNSNLPPNRLVGFLLFAGASIFSHISDNLPDPKIAPSGDWVELRSIANFSGNGSSGNNAVALFRSLAQQAFQSGFLTALPTMLAGDQGGLLSRYRSTFTHRSLGTGGEEVDSLASNPYQVLLATIGRSLFWFARQFDLTQLSGAEDLFAGALNGLIRKSPLLCRHLSSAKLGGADDARVLQSLWQSAATQVPLAFIRFAHLTESLFSLDTALAGEAATTLLSLPVAAQDARQIDPRHVTHLGDGMIRNDYDDLTVAVGPFATIKIPPQCTGKYVTLPSGEAIVQWNYKISGWDILMDWLAIAVSTDPHRLSTGNGLPLVRSAVYLIRQGLVNFKSMGMQIFGSERNQLFRKHYWPILMDQLSALFDRFSRYALSLDSRRLQQGERAGSGNTIASLVEDILVGCLQALGAFIIDFDDSDYDEEDKNRIWPFLKQANLVRSGGSNVSSASAGANLARLRQMIEIPAGRYRITAAFVGLLKAIVQRLGRDAQSPPKYGMTLSSDALLLAQNYLLHFVCEICGGANAGTGFSAAGNSSTFLTWPVAAISIRYHFVSIVLQLWQELLGNNPMAPLLAALSDQPAVRESALGQWGKCLYESAVGQLISTESSLASGQGLPSTPTFLLSLFSGRPTAIAAATEWHQAEHLQIALQLLKSLLLIRQTLRQINSTRSAIDGLLLMKNQVNGKTLLMLLSTYTALPWGTLVPIVAAQIMAQYVHILQTCLPIGESVSLASHLDGRSVIGWITERLSSASSSDGSPVVALLVPLILFSAECLQSQARLAELIVRDGGGADHAASPLIDQIVGIIVGQSVSFKRPVLLAACLHFLKSLWTLAVSTSGPFRQYVDRLRSNTNLICEGFAGILLHQESSLPTGMQDPQQKALRHCHWRVAQHRVLAILAAECRRGSAVMYGRLNEPVRQLLKRLLDSGAFTDWLTGGDLLPVLASTIQQLASASAAHQREKFGTATIYRTLLWSTAIDQSLQYGPRFAYNYSVMVAAAASAKQKSLLEDDDDDDDKEEEEEEIAANIRWSQVDSCQKLLTGWSELMGIIAASSGSRISGNDDWLLPPDLSDHLLGKLVELIVGEQQQQQQHQQHSQPQSPLLRSALLTPLCWLYALILDRQVRQMQILPSASRALEHFHRWTRICESLDQAEMISKLSKDIQTTAGEGDEIAYYHALWTALNGAISLINRQSDDRLAEAEQRDDSSVVLTERMLFIFRLAASCLHDLPSTSSAGTTAKSMILAAMASIIRTPVFARKTVLWEPLVRQFDLVNHTASYMLSASQPSRPTVASLAASPTLAASLDLLHQFCTKSTIVCRQFVDSGGFEVLRCMAERRLLTLLSESVVEFNYQSQQSTQKTYVQLLALFIGLLETAGSDDDKTVFNSFQLLDTVWPRIAAVFSAVSGVSMEPSEFPLSPTMIFRDFESLLAELNLSARLFYQLVGSYSSWKRRRPELANRYLHLALPTLCQLVDWICHPNRFSQHPLVQSLPARQQQQPRNADDNNLLIQIIECLLGTIYVLTYAWQPFQCRPDEWDGPMAIFQPSLTITAPGSPIVALGTLNSLLAYCKDHGGGSGGGGSSTTQPPPTTMMKRRIRSIAELAMTLFIAQTVYSLATPSIDGRLREQIRLEVGGELAAAVDAFANSLQYDGNDSYFTRLQSFVNSKVLSMR